MRLPKFISRYPKTYIIFTDGATRAPQKRSGLGAVVRDPAHQILYLWYQSAGPLTNNEAEYEAALMALERLREKTPHRLHAQMQIDLYTDSQVLVEQMSGKALTHAPGLRKAQARLRALVIQFARVTFHHIPREENQLADALASEAAKQKI